MKPLLSDLETELSKNLAETEPEAKPRPKRGLGTRVLIPFRFNTAARKQLKVIAAQQGKKQQDLATEALNDLFCKYGRKPVA